MKRHKDCHGNPMTLQQVADALGLSTEKVREIEISALRKLRRSPEAKALRDSFFGDGDTNVTETVNTDGTRAMWSAVFSEGDRVEARIGRPMMMAYAPSTFSRGGAE